MTVESYGTGTVSEYDPLDGGAIPGLEDFDPSEVAVPRWNIHHENRTFIDSLTNEERTELDVVILGLQKQRILWPKELDASKSPLCKSRDSRLGYPLLEPNGPKGLIFPWEDSVFTPESMGEDANGNGTLGCSNCNLREWSGQGKDATPPACNEQYTFVICDEDGGGQALFTTQRTGIKSAKRYITDFVRGQKPMFVVKTTIKLLEQKKGTGPRAKIYCVPEYHKGEATPQDMWTQYRNTFIQIQNFITAPPRDGNGANGDGSGAAAATASTAVGLTPGHEGNEAAKRELKKPPARVAPPAPKPTEDSFTPDDDDLPF